MERPIRYIRENFFYGRTFLNDADLDDQRTRWLEKANQRVHRTTNEVPLERFERDERHLLRPLATSAYLSVLLPPEPVERLVSGVPVVAVEKRSLAVYAAIARGGA